MRTVPHTCISVRGIPGERVALESTDNGRAAQWRNLDTGETWTAEPPYGEWCHGNPTIADCVAAGYCRRAPCCSD